MAPEGSDHFTRWNVGPQQLLVDFTGGRIGNDAGLLAVRALERPWRLIADLAQRLPDPRAPLFIRHSVEALLTQQVYALLAGYPDHNDHDDLRHDPLFQVLADQSPDAEQPLASGSTLARFQYAFTRRQAELPPNNGRPSWRPAPPRPSASRSSMAICPTSSSAPACGRRPRSFSTSMPPTTPRTARRP